MRVPDVVMGHIDGIVGIVSILGALACVYLAKVTGKEHDPFVWLQQISLGILAIGLFANGLYVFPEWALINGHRPTGIIVECAVAFNMIVMAARSYLRFWGKNGTGNGVRANGQRAS
jgi:hypothetical protein